MNDRVATELVGKLDVLVRLVAVGLCEGKAQSEKIVLLDLAGLPPMSIAELIGTTSNTVRVTLSGLRKKAKGKSTRKKKGAAK